MTEGKYSIGDPVWSKMKGYSPWPSRIAAPHESTLKNTVDKLKNPKVHYLVYFFGSNNFAWMAEDTIKPYEEMKDKNKNGCKSAKFKQGLTQIEEYIANGGKDTLVIDPPPVAPTRNITNNDAVSPRMGSESPTNDASNLDGLPSMDEEIYKIKNERPTPKSASSKKSKTTPDSHNDSSSLTSPAPSSGQKTYTRMPFQSRKTTRGDDSSSETASPTKRTKTIDDHDIGVSTLSSPTVSSSISTSKPPTTKTGARNILMKSSYEAPVLDTPVVNMSAVSAKTKSIRASRLKFGFIGLGFMGQRLLKNLLNSGHQVTIWNRTHSKCKSFIEAGATSAPTPSDVVAGTDIVISCLSDPVASKEIVFGTFGILAGMNSDKGYVEMSSIDPETSNDISEALVARGGRYLEAPMVANGKTAAEEGELTIVAAGDKTLYDDCTSCFQAMAKQSFFLGYTMGGATKMNLIMSMLYGSMLGSLIECCALVELAGLQTNEFKEILKLSSMNCPLLVSVMNKVPNKDNVVEMPLGHLQKDLRLSLNLAEEFGFSCPIAAATNEVFKGAKRQGHTEHDASYGLYHRTRF